MKWRPVAEGQANEYIIHIYISNIRCEGGALALYILGAREYFGEVIAPSIYIIYMRLYAHAPI